MKVKFRSGDREYEGVTRWAHYQESGENALTLFTEDGEPLITPTVALWPPAPMAGEEEVWLKTWAEGEYMPEALAEAGVVELTDEYHPTGHSVARKARLTEAALAEIRERYEADDEATKHKVAARSKRALELGAGKP